MVGVRNLRLVSYRVSNCIGKESGLVLIMRYSVETSVS